MKRKHQRTLALIFARPTSANVQWRDIEAMFDELGAEVSEREGSRVAVVMYGEVRVFHRPHPSPNTDKGAVASIRKWLEQHGAEPLRRRPVDLNPFLVMEKATFGATS